MEPKTKNRIVAVFVVALAAITMGCISEETEEPPEGNFTILSEQYLEGSLYIAVIHYDDKNMTCLIYSDAQKGGISCIPDWQLTPPQTSKDCNYT